MTTEQLALTDQQQLDELHERVARGIAWLTEADPSGGQYFRYKAGLTRLSPMPSLDDGEKEAWIRWYDNMVLYEQLMGRLERLERKVGVSHGPRHDPG